MSKLAYARRSAKFYATVQNYQREVKRSFQGKSVEKDDMLIVPFKFVILSRIRSFLGRLF